MAIIILLNSFKLPRNIRKNNIFPISAISRPFSVGNLLFKQYFLKRYCSMSVDLKPFYICETPTQTMTI